MTEKTQPTDAEIVELLGDPRYSTIEAVRAAIAKWGTPAGEGEVVAWRYRMKGDLQWQYTERKEQFAHADEVQPLATPQPTQAHIEKCAVCGDGNARLLVMRNCDVCGSDYAGQSESEVNVALERARRATQAQAGADAVVEEVANGLRRYGLTLVKTASGYDVLSLREVAAHDTKGADHA